MSKHYTLDEALESMDIHVNDAAEQLKAFKLQVKYHEGFYNGLMIGLTMLKDIKEGLEDEHNHENTERTETV